MACLWHISPCLFDHNNKLQAVEWGAEVSLYNCNTGDTHLFNLFPFEILQFLVSKNAGLAAVSEHMAVLCDEKNNAVWSNKILSTLKQLEELDLIDCH